MTGYIHLAILGILAINGVPTQLNTSLAYPTVPNAGMPPIQSVFSYSDLPSGTDPNYTDTRVQARARCLTEGERYRANLQAIKAQGASAKNPEDRIDFDYAIVIKCIDG